jgi:cysteine desulfurase
VTFTSGATESIALALSPEIEIAGRALHSDALIVSGVEHPAVRAGGRFLGDRIKQIAVDKNGVVDVVALEAMLGRHDAAGRRPFVSVMAANNETGVLQPLQEIASRVHAADGFFHTDAVQIAGRIPFDLAESGADLISISSHKLGGPQGAGALIARHENIRVPPIQRGGGQERGLRAGTENVAAIVGFGVAAQEAARDLVTEGTRLARLRARLPNTSCFAVPNIAAETAVIAFDLEGIALSAGAACSSGKVGPSTTLAAMQVSAEVAKGAVRVSLGWSTTENEVSRFLEIWKRVHTNLGLRRNERAA